MLILILEGMISFFFTQAYKEKKKKERWKKKKGEDKVGRELK